MHLQLLKKSRKKTIPGDIFAFKPLKSDYMFGRTISVSAKLGGITCVLLYFFRATSPSKDKLPPLNLDQLLIPPLGSNYRPWINGYFETVSHEPLTSKHVLKQHCFYDSDRNWYLDENGTRLTKPVEPIGMYGLAGLQGIDILLNNALKK